METFIDNKKLFKIHSPFRNGFLCLQFLNCIKHLTFSMRLKSFIRSYYDSIVRGGREKLRFDFIRGQHTNLFVYAPAPA